ncbi:60S acidic ribosomal protein P3-2-like [Papaver somniferum]|uniref:60S acidic ribosomal protein P3-2-like n=1 Tax=Papaver somniferum TaxID=3469 RepID=UPI000E6FDCDC|nr:60S acidic ribosomal protein P3-2-like [Papaver somniferum]
MGVFTFVCKSKDGVWSAKQYNGDIEASADSTYDLERKLVKEVLSRDSSGAVQSYFSLVSPTSGVFEVKIGGGSFVASGGGAVAAAISGIAAASEAPAAEAKKEEKNEESDDEEIGGFFDDMFG